MHLNGSGMKFTGENNQNPPAEAVLILPKNYGLACVLPKTRFGVSGDPTKFRQLFGLKSNVALWYGYSLDIAYDDSSFALPSNYKTVYYWNSTIT